MILQISRIFIIFVRLLEDKHIDESVYILSWMGNIENFNFKSTKDGSRTHHLYEFKSYICENCLFSTRFC
jgi:hypothetical protein